MPPEIADADRGIVKIGMEDWREHAALWRAPRITQRKIYFEVVGLALLYLSGRGNEESFDVVNEAIDFRRHSGSTTDLDKRPARKSLNELVVIQF